MKLIKCVFRPRNRGNALSARPCYLLVGMGIRMKALYLSSSLWNSWKCLNFLLTCHVNSPCVNSIVYRLILGIYGDRCFGRNGFISDGDSSEVSPQQTTADCYVILKHAHVQAVYFCVSVWHFKNKRSLLVCLAPQSLCRDHTRCAAHILKWQGTCRGTVDIAGATHLKTVSSLHPSSHRCKTHLP